jgi:hypothetical protein
MSPEMAALRRIIETQRKPGTWNYSPYTHGLANGLLLAFAILEGRANAEFFDFLDPPEDYICDTSSSESVPDPIPAEVALLRTALGCQP